MQFFFFKYLFISPALGLSRDLWGLCRGRHVGSGSPTRDQTRGSLHWEQGILPPWTTWEVPWMQFFDKSPWSCPPPPPQPHQFLLGFLFSTLKFSMSPHSGLLWVDVLSSDFYCSNSICYLSGLKKFITFRWPFLLSCAIVVLLFK